MAPLRETSERRLRGASDIAGMTLAWEVTAMAHPRPSARLLKLGDILDAQPVTASPHESAGAAWKRLRAADSDHLVVLRDGNVVGVLSRHDLDGPAGGTHRRMGRRVGDLMGRDVVTATPGTSVRGGSMRMRRRGVGCLPIVARGRLVGLVTVARLLEVLEKVLTAT
jgi:acetoin utilization protein AcuB